MDGPKRDGIKRDRLAEIIECLRAANAEGLVSAAGLDALSGLSGRKTLGAIQRLTSLFADEADACYLEVGVYQGLTLIANAALHRGFPCFGIDNFSLLDPRGENLGIVNDRIARFGTTNAHLINEDFEGAFTHLDDHLQGRRIAVYFVDGAHDYRSQLMGLILALPFLHDDAVILVDDANFPFVRQSTRDFLIGFPAFKMVFEAYSPAHPANQSGDDLARWEAGWLNGVNVLVRDPHGRLPDMLPETPHDRTLYVNEWLVHRLQLAELAPVAVELAQAICAGDLEAERKGRAALLERYNERQAEFAARFADRNTYSAGLPEARFNELDRS